MARSSGPVQSGWRHAERWSMPGRQRPHLGDAVGDLLAEQHPAAAGLGALAEHHLDRVRGPQVVGVHPVPAREQLVDERLGLAALLVGHAAVAGRRRRPDLTGTAPEGLLGLGRERAEAHAGDRHGDVEVQGPRGVAVAEHDVGVAALAVALERVARHRRAEHQQVVEVRYGALGAPAADVVDARPGGVLDRGDRGAVERGRLAQPPLRGILHRVEPRFASAAVSSSAISSSRGRR